MRVEVVVTSCKVCGGHRTRSVSHFKVKKNPTYIRCGKCASAYSMMQISILALSAYYNGYYTAENLVIPKHIKKSISKTVATFSRFRTASNSICDLGYGAGALLEIAQEDGWRCSGSEYSPEAIEIGKVNGWDVHEGDLGDEDLSGPFDVITIVETLEHVQNPHELISNASVRLRRGGLIYGTTPNGRSLNSFLLGEEWSMFSFPEHLNLMSKKGIEILLLSNGFTNIEIHSQGINPHDIIRKAKNIFSKGQHLKSRDKSRVEFGYQLVEMFSANWFMRFLKRLVNCWLSLLGIGDTLVFRAIRK